VGEIATERLALLPELQGPLAEQFRRAGSVTALDICDAAEAGDRLAQLLVDETSDWLVRAITNLAFTLDPELVLLGGAMDFGGANTATGRRFLDRVRAGVHRGVFPQIANSLRVEFARLGGSAGWIGAAGLARREWKLARNQSLSP
jgi:glucokinase